MTPKNFTKHRGKESRCTLNSFGKSERGQKKTNQVPRLARENVSMEVHHVVRQGASKERVNALVVQPSSTISAHIPVCLGLACRFLERRIGVIQGISHKAYGFISHEGNL